MQTLEQKIAATRMRLFRLRNPGANAVACKRYYYAKKARLADATVAAA
jgi:hypothetical protein